MAEMDKKIQKEAREVQAVGEIMIKQVVGLQTKPLIFVLALAQVMELKVPILAVDQGKVVEVLARLGLGLMEVLVKSFQILVLLVILAGLAEAVGAGPTTVLARLVLGVREVEQLAVILHPALEMLAAQIQEVVRAEALELMDQRGVEVLGVLG